MNRQTIVHLFAMTLPYCFCIDQSKFHLTQIPRNWSLIAEKCIKTENVQAMALASQLSSYSNIYQLFSKNSLLNTKN